MVKPKIGANAIFSGPQKGLSIIGRHCYAYSGTQVVANQEKLVLAFTVGKEYLIVKVAMSVDITGVGTGEDWGMQIKLNGNQIVDHEYNPSNYGREPDDVKLVLPPFTVFEGYLSTTDVSDIIMGMTLTGKVYTDYA